MGRNGAREVKDLPIVCELTPGEIAARREGLLPGLLEQARELVFLPHGIRSAFAPSSDLLNNLVRMIDAERQCCKFLKFALTVEPDDGQILLEITGPAGTTEFLKTLLQEES